MHTNIRFAITGDLNRFNTTNLCQELGLQNIVTQSTPQRSILDVILTDAEFYTADVVSLIPLIGRSQHNCVLCQPAPQAPPSYTVRRYRPWRDSSLLAFGQWITLEPWDDILQTQDVNEAVMMLEHVAYSVGCTPKPSYMIEGHRSSPPYGHGWRAGGSACPARESPWTRPKGWTYTLCQWASVSLRRWSRLSL